jgi:hypothetical protein
VGLGGPGNALGRRKVVTILQQFCSRLAPRPRNLSFTLGVMICLPAAVLAVAGGLQSQAPAPHTRNQSSSDSHVRTIIDRMAATLTEAFKSTPICSSMLRGPHETEKLGHGSDSLSSITQLSANNSLGSPHLCRPCRKQASTSRTASAFAWFSSKPVDDRSIPTTCLGPSLWMTEHDRCNDVVVLWDLELGFNGR